MSRRESFSEMIKEVDIGILDGVNEMCPDEKKIHVAFLTGHLWTSKRTAKEAGRGLLSDKHRIVFDNAMHFLLR